MHLYNGFLPSAGAHGTRLCGNVIIGLKPSRGTYNGKLKRCWRPEIDAKPSFLALKPAFARLYRFFFLKIGHCTELEGFLTHEDMNPTKVYR